MFITNIVYICISLLLIIKSYEKKKVGDIHSNSTSALLRVDCYQRLLVPVFPCIHMQAYVNFQYTDRINKPKTVKIAIQHLLSSKKTITDLELIHILKPSVIVFIKLCAWGFQICVFSIAMSLVNYSLE